MTKSSRPGPRWRGEVDTSTSPACPACGGELLLRRVDGLHVVEYRALCPGCQWARWLRELWCGGCHGLKLFEWTNGTWRCILCDHVGGSQPLPRALHRHEPSGPGGLQPDDAGTYPRRGPYSRGEAVGRILEAVPCDRWVSAAEIAAVVGVSSHLVGALIGSSLLDTDVERRPTRSSGCSPYLYRRLRHVDALRRIPGSRRSPVADDTDGISAILSGDQPGPVSS